MTTGVLVSGDRAQEERSAGFRISQLLTMRANGGERAAVASMFD